MGQQLTVRLPDEMATALESAARRLRRRRSEIVRLALERFLQALEEEVEPSWRPIDRVQDLLGAIESGVSDLGKHHREHLIERLRASQDRAQR